MGNSRLKKLIGPLILEQFFAVSVGIVDTFMVSRVGEAAVSGVALVDSMSLLVIQVMAAFAAGGIVVISQYIGEQNDSMVFVSSRHLEILMNVFSVCVMFICLLFGNSILGGLFPKIDAEVMNAASTYLLISGISFVFWGMYTSGAAILRCHEDTKTAMGVSLLMNVLNVVLNAYFVFIAHLGVLGVAVATLISRTMAGITMKTILIVRQKKQFIDVKAEKHLSWSVFKSILSMGIPSGIENGMFHVGKIVVASMLATLGTNAIAANSIAYQIIEFPNIPGVTIGLALVVIVGQDIGAGNKEEAVTNTKKLVRYAYIGDWICKIILFVIAPYIVAAFSLSAETSDITVLVLRCFAITSLPIWPLSFTLPSALRGAGDVKYSMVVSVISMWVCRIVVSYILVIIFHMGILGVWIGMFTDWYARGIGYLARFKSGKWLDKKAI